jgi:hypothetical protein
MPLRNPSADELRLLQHLISLAPAGLISPDWRTAIKVEPLDDGGMGSLAITPSEHVSSNRTFGLQVSECRFRDEDGIEVVASLNADRDGELFELDIWKTDFSGLVRIPEKLEP